MAKEWILNSAMNRFQLNFIKPDGEIIAGGIFSLVNIPQYVLSGNAHRDVFRIQESIAIDNIGYI